MTENEKRIIAWLHKIREHIVEQTGIDQALVRIRVGTWEVGHTYDQLKRWQDEVGLKFTFVAEASDKTQ